MLSMVPPPKKRRKTVSAIEEIKFDPNAREDYLTGFHKRKLQRIKHAQEEAAKREREDKIKARKTVRFPYHLSTGPLLIQMAAATRRAEG